MVEPRLSGLELLQRKLKRRRRVERTGALVLLALALALTVNCCRAMKNAVDGGQSRSG